MFSCLSERSKDKQWKRKMNCWRHFNIFIDSNESGSENSEIYDKFSKNLKSEENFALSILFSQYVMSMIINVIRRLPCGEKIHLPASFHKFYSHLTIFSRALSIFRSLCCGKDRRQYSRSLNSSSSHDVSFYL